MANATKRVRTREKARVRWLQHTSLVLQEILEFPPVDFPAFVGPEEYRKLHEVAIEASDPDFKATGLRDSSYILDSPTHEVKLVKDRLYTTSGGGQRNLYQILDSHH